ncbi:MAG TPA: methyltransferase domain-containing protein [Nitrososphaera sp.]|nr:methyltransferase domain-containing protein [Nitrososphaera sp.]
MFSDPGHNIDQLGLSDGAVVADFGSGSGYYAIAAGRAVAPTGKVYAIDVQKDLLERLKKEAQREHVTNIEVLTGNLERLGGSKIREGSCDVVIASNILFMLDDKKSFLNEAKRILKMNGRFLLIDWAASFSQMGPHPDHVVYKDDAIKLCASVGLSLDREINAGSHHYGIIFRKK